MQWHPDNLIITTIWQCPLWVVGSTGDRNTLTFLWRWSVGHEAAASHLLLGGPTG